MRLCVQHILPPQVQSAELPLGILLLILYCVKKMVPCTGLAATKGFPKVPQKAGQTTSCTVSTLLRARRFIAFCNPLEGLRISLLAGQVQVQRMHPKNGSLELGSLWFLTPFGSLIYGSLMGYTLHSVYGVTAGRSHPWWLDSGELGWLSMWHVLPAAGGCPEHPVAVLPNSCLESSAPSMVPS